MCEGLGGWLPLLYEQAGFPAGTRYPLVLCRFLLPHRSPDFLRVLSGKRHIILR